jgi:hypothetical protein
MDSYWIHVDTDTLRGFSKGYSTRAGVFTEAGNGIQFSILSIIDRMPEYDGRPQPAARADAIDIFNRCQEFYRGFTADSEFLLKTAEAFEEIDGETVHIFDECRGITSTACLIDAKGNPGLGTTTTQEAVVNPDGSVSTISIVKTINSDGSVTTITTIQTIKVLDAITADGLNKEEKDADIILGIVVLGALGVVTGGLACEIALAAGSTALAASNASAVAGVVVPGIVDGVMQIKGNHDPERGWQAGDTITNTVTIETTTPKDITRPEDDIPPPSDITNATVVTDKDGTEISIDTRGMESTGSVK